MDYRFIADILALKPPLFRAILNFNREYVSPLPEELASLGAPFTDLWHSPDFRKVWPERSSDTTGYWNFFEESQRMALLESGTIERLGLFLSAAVHAEELSRIIARAQVLELRRELGEDVVTYALKRGRYQIGGLRALLLVPASFGSLTKRIRLLADAAPTLVSEGWPEELRRLAMNRFPHRSDEGQDQVFAPALPKEQRTALWFTMKKLLLREVAPEWAPCFD